MTIGWDLEEAHKQARQQYCATRCDVIIAVDFDGTLVDHRFPEIGAEVPGAIAWLKQFQVMGVRLILWTMRSDRGGGGPHNVPEEPYLTQAVEWCRERGIEFWAVNKNPEQASWTASPKVYAHIYIDDAASGCPLRENPRMGGRPFVDWDRVGSLVVDRLRAGVLK